MSFKGTNKRSVPRHTTESRATAGTLERGAERITRREGHASIAEQLEEVECPACGGEGNLLGSLGRRVHFRCRGCGIDFSKEN